MNLDRFSHGLPDPQCAKILTYCSVCGKEIYKGNLIYFDGDEIICSKDCVVENKALKMLVEEALERMR